MTVDPLQSLQITKTELERIWTADPDAYWTLFYQCCDCFDLFQSHLNLPFKDPVAFGNAATAKDQLQASARQLVAAATDSALAQACCLAAELAGKAILKEENCPVWGHDIAEIYSVIVERFPAITNADVIFGEPFDAELCFGALLAPKSSTKQCAGVICQYAFSML